MENRYIATNNESEKLWSEEYDPKAKDKTILDKLINIAKEEKYNVNKIVLTEQN